MLQASKGYIVVGCCIKTCDGWVAGVEFLQETGHERAQSDMSYTKNNTYILHAKHGHPLEAITHATGMATGIHHICIFKPCEDCALGKAKRAVQARRCCLIQNRGRNTVF